MKQAPGFLNTLQTQLEALPIDCLERVNRSGGLEIRDLLDFLVRPKDYTADLPDDEQPDVMFAEITADAEAIGRQAIESGEVGFCVLAGGDGTRLGLSKAFLKLPKSKTSLLGLKILQSEGLEHVWVMASPSNKKEISRNQAVKTRNIKVFTQFESFRLTPDNQLYSSTDGPSFHPCGHGDMPVALKQSGILKDFIEAGGKYIFVSNVDNLFAMPDPKIIGQHIVAGKPITCEVTPHDKTDTGGVLCNHMGFKQVVEKFRLSSEADPSSYSWLSTNSMVINANLDFDSIRWSWHRVKKTVEGRLLVQYERLLQDLTAVYQTQFVGVERKCRYVPVKTQADLKVLQKLFCKEAV